MIFPGNRIGGKLTINGAHGFIRKIADRFDLALECIRRHYLNQRSPLSETLARYRDFFAWFEDLRGYVEFFMLQDLVTNDYSSVRFFMPFDDFKTPSVPKGQRDLQGISPPQHRFHHGQKLPDRPICRAVR